MEFHSENLQFFGRKLLLTDTVNFKIKKLESQFFLTLKLTVSVKSNFRPKVSSMFSVKILRNMDLEKLFARNRHGDS